MAKPRLKLVTPTSVNRTVMPRRRPNADLRTREHLTEAEVERLIDAAKRNRHGHRDATMVLMAYRHARRNQAADGAAVLARSVSPDSDERSGRRARRQPANGALIAIE